MSMLKMQKISICALKKHRKDILETLQRKGVVEITDLELQDSVFFKEETSASQASFLKSSQTAKQAAEILCEYNDFKKSMFATFEGREPISKENYYIYVNDAAEIMRVAYEIIGFKKNINEANADIIKYESQIESLIPWKSFELSLRFKGTEKTQAFVGTFPNLISEGEILSEIAQINPELDGIDVNVISSDKNQTCVFLICKREKSDKLFEAIRQMGFSSPAVDSKQPPAERIKILNERIENLKNSVEENINNIKSHKGMLHAFNFIEDYYVMRAEKYEQIESLSNTRHVFLLSGYITEKNAPELQALLISKYGAEVEMEDDFSDDAPVVLHNNPIARPVEGVLQTYSLPKRREIDPTSIMAIFYYVFFGMMFSDAGYGIVMSLACGFALHHFKNMEEGLKKSVKMFFYCGLSTTFWGLMFGSFFGDAVSVISTTFLGIAPEQVPQIPGLVIPIWFNPINDPMRLLMICFLFGIIHLFTGLAIQGYMHIKNKHPMFVIYDVVSWYLLIGGAILALLSLDMMKDLAGFVLPPVFLTIGGIAALIGAVIIVFFSGRESKNPVKRLLKGIYGLYGATGYLSDILSYSRLLALGLATGVIAQVFNQIGSMFGSSIFAIIIFAVVFIIGHVLNIGINALGAYVHTNRLQFVEFFGKFYEGGGKAFKPFKINSKHYKVKEDI